MIEIEIKCKPTPEQKAALLADATFVSEENLIDRYYDSAAYELTTKDFWLRTRNGKFMLKIPAANCSYLANQANTPKHELEDEQEIRKILNLSNQGTLEQAVINAGYKLLYTLEKTRQKHTKDVFIIDIDCATHGKIILELVELETMVEKPEEISEATEKLVNFAHQHGIEIEPIPGNLIALIKIINPEHLEILERARAKRSK